MKTWVFLIFENGLGRGGLAVPWPWLNGALVIVAVDFGSWLGLLIFKKMKRPIENHDNITSISTINGIFGKDREDE